MQVNPIMAAVPSAVPQKTLPTAPGDTVTLGGAPPREVSRAVLLSVFGTATPKSPQVIWQAPLDDMERNPRGGGFLPAKPVLAPDGSLYVGTNRGELKAFAPDGTLRWHRDLGEPSPYHDPTLAYDGSLVLTNEHDTRLLRLSADNAIIYDTNLPEPARSRPVFDMDGRLYVVGEKGLHAVEPDGTLAWSRDLPAQFTGQYVRPDGTVLVYGRNPDMSEPVVLRCYGRDGVTLWNYTFQGEAGGVPVTGIHDETIVTDGSKLRFIDAQGNVTLDQDLGAGKLGEIATAPDGKIYVASENTLIALDADAKPLWRASYPMRGRHPITVGGDGTVYASTRDARIHALRGENGRNRWTADLGKDGDHCRVIPAPDGTVFVDRIRDVVVIDNEGLKRGRMEGLLTASPDTPLNGRIAVSDLKNVSIIAPADFTVETSPPDTATDPRDPGKVERQGDWVIINGVKVPVRKSGGF